MGKDVCSGPLGDVGVGEEILSNVRIPRVSRTWGLLPLIPSGPELLRVAPPRIVVRHCRLGTKRKFGSQEETRTPDAVEIRVVSLRGCRMFTSSTLSSAGLLSA
jgi:hypothetical protein